MHPVKKILDPPLHPPPVKYHALAAFQLHLQCCLESLFYDAFADVYRERAFSTDE